jgi:4-amino-4-deoxy-L-arabinose transferase-like glycosyltransferase
MIPAAIVVLAAVLRIAWLDQVPPAVNQDEAVHAYEAYCLRTTGGDHVGSRFPFFFHCFGRADHHAAPFIWLQVPLQAAFGMNVWTTRLPSAIAGVVAVWLLYQLMNRWYGRRPALLAALLLAVSPWHVHLSRLAFEVSICPTLILLGFLLLRGVRPAGGASQKLSWSRLFAAGMVFGLTAWTYNAMRIFVPLVLLGAGVIYIRQIRELFRGPRGLPAGTCFVAGLGAGLAPFVYAWITDPEAAWGRAASLSILSGADGVPPLYAFVRAYWSNVSPRFLFLQGDPYVVQSMPGYGQLHHYMVLLLPLGLYAIFRHWRSGAAQKAHHGRSPDPAPPLQPGLLILWWLLIAPVPAALAAWWDDSGHALRAAGALPAYQMLGAIGLDWLLSTASRRSGRAFVTAALISALGIALNAGVFLHRFFSVYPQEAAAEFQSEWAAVFRDVARLKNDYDAVLITTRRTNQIGMSYLFWTQMPPSDYFTLPRQIMTGEYYDNIGRVGDVYFLPVEVLPKLFAVIGPQARVLVAERPEVPVPGRQIKRYSWGDGQPAVVLYEVRGRSGNH